MYNLISHRGIATNNIKENTFEAIKNALEDDNYMGVEFDIRETLDSEFILFHNNLYNDKLIYKTKYNELPKYVPKLEDVLKINSNKIFLIEIKNISNFDKFINLIQKYCNQKIYIMSFSNKIIEKIAKEDRCYKIGVLNYVFNTTNFIKKLDFVGILNSLLNDDTIINLKNKEIFSYGVFKKMKYKNVYYIVDNKKD